MHNQVLSGGAISVKRAELLANIAGNLGASASAMTSSVLDAKGPCAGGHRLFIVAAQTLSREELCKRLPDLADLQAEERATVVGDSWVSKCAEEKRLCATDEHLHMARPEIAALDAPVSQMVQPPQKVLVGGLAVDAIGFGSMSLGVTYPEPAKRPSREDAIAMIHTALELGCEFFDTADAYSTNGNDFGYVEEILRDALASFPREKSSSTIVATKG